MNNNMKTEQKVIALSAQIIRLFYGRKITDMLPMLDENYLWIGNYAFQWAKGLDAFVKVTRAESEELPPLLSNEHYQLQLQSGNIWVICGEYMTTYQVDTGYLCQDLVRITFIWEQFGDSFKLNHIHGSNVQDLSSPLSNTTALPSGPFYQYVKNVKSAVGKLEANYTPAPTEINPAPPATLSDEMLVLRDESERYHNLLPLEILFLEAANQWCRVYTPFENFLTFGSLTSFEKRLPGFARIHRSYLVNTRAIVKLRFGKLWLWNETMLPVSKSRYPQIKQLLESSPVHTGRLAQAED